MAGTQTAQQVLGLTDFDPDVVGTTSDAAKDTSKDNYRTADVTVNRVSGEYDDQDDPATDLRRGGRPGAAVTITKDTSVDHDGYGGRGNGPHYVAGTFDSSR